MAGITIGAFIVVALYFIFINIIDGWAFALPVSSIVLAVGVSTVTGVIFGIYPARQAAQKNPIEALRYE
jgi:ABC-type antimicrobial peptide transport system permease subunit